MSAKKERELGARAAKYFRLRASGKRAYQRADVLLDEIVQHGKPGQPIKLPDGDVAVVKDVYLTANKVFRAHGISRYELERLDGVTGKRVST